MPLAALLAALNEQLAQAKLPLRGDPFGAQFRLHRDVRFSADKRLFKTNAGAVLSQGGSKRSPGLLYIHLDPAGCFAAAGFWQPEPAQLGRLSAALVADPAGWAEVERAMAKAGLALEREGALIRPPRGFEGASAAVLEDLKLKNWILRRPLPARALGKPALVEEIVAFALAAAPLLRFGWAALQETRQR